MRAKLQSIWNALVMFFQTLWSRMTGGRDEPLTVLQLDLPDEVSQEVRPEEVSGVPEPPKLPLPPRTPLMLPPRLVFRKSHSKIYTKRFADARQRDQRWRARNGMAARLSLGQRRTEARRKATA